MPRPANRPARVLLMRPRGREPALRTALQSAGCDVVCIPAVQVEPAENPGAIDEALAAEHDWYIFCSVNGVAAVLSRGRVPHRAGVAAVGPITAAALIQAGVDVGWVPQRYTTESLAGHMPGSGSAGVFRAAGSSPRLEEILRSRGFAVSRVDAYRTRPINAAAIADEVARGVDAVVVTSASIAFAFATALGSASQPAVLCSIGPATTAACASQGLRVDLEADQHTGAGVASALVEALRARESL